MFLWGCSGEVSSTNIQTAENQYSGRLRQKNWRHIDDFVFWVSKTLEPL
jgi:hypothetical protein